MRPLSSIPKCERRSSSWRASNVRPRRVRTSPEELARRFERGGYVRQAITQGYRCCLKKTTKPLYANLPPGTLSLTVGFLDNQGRFKFMVHLYLRPNGEIAASGLLDPKALIEDDGIEYYVG